MLPENHPLFPTEVFFLELYKDAPPDQHIEIRALWNDSHTRPPAFKGKKTLEQYMQVKTIEKQFDMILADWVMQYNRMGYDVYFGVNPRKVVPRGTDGNPLAARAEHISHSVCAWNDIDDMQWEKKLGISQMTPTFVVATGHGCHLYFKYKTFVAVHKAVSDSKALEPIVGGDNTSDPVRILRVPGTRNWKDLDKEVFCSIVDLKPEVIFNGAPDKDAIAAPGSVDGLPASLRDTIILGHGAAVPPYVDPEDPTDRSKVDARVCAELYTRGWSEEQVRTVMVNPEFGVSAKVIEEGANGENYLQRTLKWAREQSERNIMKGFDVGETLIFETCEQIKNAPPLTFVIDRVLPFGGMLLISGPSKAGKSLVTTEMIMLLAGGLEQIPEPDRAKVDIDFRFLRTFSVNRPGRVAYLQAEVSRGSLAYRLNRIAGSLNIDWLKLPVFFSNRSLDLGESRNLSSLVNGLKKTKADYLVIDPLARFHSLNENKHSDMSRLLGGIQRVGQEAGLSGIILVHHHGKPVEGAEREGVHRIRGASVIGDWGNAHVLLRKKFSEVTGRKYVTIEFELRDAEEPPPMDMALIRDDLRFDRFSENEERTDIVREALEKFPTEKDKAVEEIRKRGGTTKLEAERLYAKKRLEDRMNITKEGKGAQTVPKQAKPHGSTYEADEEEVAETTAAEEDDDNGEG